MRRFGTGEGGDEDSRREGGTVDVMQGVPLLNSLVITSTGRLLLARFVLFGIPDRASRCSACIMPSSLLAPLLHRYKH